MSSFYNRKSLFTESILDLSVGTNAEKIYSFSVNEFDFLKSNSELIAELVNIDYCSGVLLDSLASNFGTGRLNNETDIELRTKIKTTALSKISSGSAIDIINIIKAFDNVNSYENIQNPESDIQVFNGQNKLSGGSALKLKHEATFYITRNLTDLQYNENSLNEFIYNARGSGINGILFLRIELTTPNYLQSTSLKLDGSLKLNGSTKFNQGIQFNNLKLDGNSKLDGSKKFKPYSIKYNIDRVVLLDDTNTIVYSNNFTDRFLNGKFIYSALVNETESNGKNIKTIQFYSGNILVIEKILTQRVTKKNSLRILFFINN